MLFNFELKPLRDVTPWGSPGEESLHWFGLTEGAYWISLGDDELLRYSDQVAHRGRSLTEKWDLYCDYYVIRLYEDLMEMLPYVLEPMPNTLIPYICGDSGLYFEKQFSSWCDKFDGRIDGNEFDQVIDQSCVWIGKRTLDTGYLSPSAHIRLWSNDDSVTIHWDNRKKKIGGISAWSALYGEKSISRATFVDEIRSFHTRLMETMGARVQDVLSGHLAPNIKIDRSALAKEHEQRSRWSDRALGKPPISTNWPLVTNAIARVEREVSHAAA